VINMIFSPEIKIRFNDIGFRSRDMSGIFDENSQEIYEKRRLMEFCGEDHFLPDLTPFFCYETMAKELA